MLILTLTLGLEEVPQGPIREEVPEGILREEVTQGAEEEDDDELAGGEEG